MQPLDNEVNRVLLFFDVLDECSADNVFKDR